MPLQFLIVVKESSSTCNAVPLIVGDLPLDACLVANRAFSARIVAQVIFDRLIF